MNIMMELRQARAAAVEEMKALSTAAEVENRDITAEEQEKWDGLVKKVDELDARMARLDALEKAQGAAPAPDGTGAGKRNAPAHLKNPLGDSEAKALAVFARSGDLGGFPAEMRGQNAVTFRLPRRAESRAVTDSTMNITTNADGKYLAPDGFVNEVARRKQEGQLATRLGVRRIPGTGTTVNYPLQAADAQVFATTNEQADNHSVAWERDAPQVGQKAFTLVLKTKKIELTDQLLYDEDAGLMEFIAGVVADGMVLTHNSALLAEVGANGTSLKTFNGAAAIADGELEDIVYHNTLGYYLDDSGAVGWVMRPPTFGAISKISGTARIYANPNSGGMGREVLGYPVSYSAYAAAMAASAKSVYFGNWSQVGYREDPTLTLLRDPYTVDGLTILKYSFRLVYGVLQAGGIGYGVHPTA